MVWIALAASSIVFSRTKASACGSRVWSMISTDHPSGASQIVRYALPSMFTLSIQGVHGRTERNVERLVQSARPAGECIPLGIRPRRAVDDIEDGLSARWARHRRARIRPPSCHAAVGLAKL